ncbi:MAG: ATP-binding cassette domain-containing protein [Syntrophales bacterium]|nr:ATP-binding cassette domain-containing protein [Syntrophales bacterium]
MSDGQNPLIDITSLAKVYRVTRSITQERVWIKALDGVDLSIWKGETLGVVGESGCGKSTLGRLVVLLDRPTTGRIAFKGKDVLGFKGETLKAFRRQVQIVFQDPASSLNPRKTVGETLREPLLIHGLGSMEEREEKVRQILKNVGLPPDYTRRFPHELSGGQRQRVCIARALILAPELIVADEPVSNLDVSIQAQILNLLKDLRDNFNLTYIFISHDLKVVRFMSDRVAVMYGGRVVEVAPSAILYENPRHPYTQLLLMAIPTGRGCDKKARLKKQTFSTAEEILHDGCTFAPRCAERKESCMTARPKLLEVEAGHWVACHISS